MASHFSRRNRMNDSPDYAKYKKDNEPFIIIIFLKNNRLIKINLE